MESQSALQRVIALLRPEGGQSELARRIGVSPQSVQRWVAANEVPVKRVIDVENAVGGQVTRYDLRPDFFGEPPQDQKNAA